MSDPSYQSANVILESKGIEARYATDQSPQGTYRNLDNLEEVEENGIATRLGSILVSKNAGRAQSLLASVHTVSKLGALGGLSFRYAGAAGRLWRQPSTTGLYSEIYTGLSGNPMITSVFRPDASSTPTMFFGDSAAMIKDNGTGTPQNNGIFQPYYPVVAQAQAPDLITLDKGNTSTAYVYTGISAGYTGQEVATTTTQAIVASTLPQTVTLASVQQVGLFQRLVLGAETILVLGVTATGITAVFTLAHATGTAVTSTYLGLTVPASTTASVSSSFANLPCGAHPVRAWPVTLDEEDYIGVWLYVSDPSQIQKITLNFDCGDGTFQSNYFYKIIGQGPLQTLLDQNTDSSTSAADAVLSETLGLYASEDSGITGLNTGLNQWTPILLQLSDFAGAGNADFNDPVFNWQNINGFQIEITSNDNTSVNVQFASLVLFGGAGPDSFAGVSYDYLASWFNINDYTESNPSMTMSDVNPPALTNRVLPRRQPVALTINTTGIDPQATHIRLYRRGGTLGDNYRRIDQIPLTGNVLVPYSDIWEDDQIQSADFVSFINDVPVTSSLITPVNTTITALSTNLVNRLVTITPASMANISQHQQVDIGNVAANNFEIVVVIGTTANSFTAYVQNAHVVGEGLAATASYGQPVTILAVSGGVMYYAGDPNNPAYLYYSSPSNPQAVGSANFVEVTTPDDPITCIIAYKGNLFIGTHQRWWSIAPGQQGASPTVYPTSADHGPIAPLGVCLMGDVIVYQAIDGWRTFSGGGSNYISQIIEFIYQGVGTTPVVQADMTKLALVRMTFWNRFVYSSYIGVDGNRHRMILDMVAKRFRNDDVDAQSLFLESDINALIYGDSKGYVHMDRQAIAYDETAIGVVIEQTPIPITLQSPYMDMGAPVAQKQWNNFVLDANTGGNEVDVTLLFNDGESQLAIGSVTTAQRARVNLNLNGGLGVQAYKVSVLLTSAGAALTRVRLYQASIDHVVLAQTRQSFDTYLLQTGEAGSKICKNGFFDYTATADIAGAVYYDGATVPFFTFTLPENGGIRTVYRQRFPAVKFRLIRVVLDSGEDFQIWPESKIECKVIRQGAGYSAFPLGVS